MNNRPYFSLFANFFLTLVISRPNFRGLAQYTLDALKLARATGRIGELFDPLIQALTEALESFDTKLTERADPTAGDTEAFRLARTAWLDFVEPVQIKVVNPGLYKQAPLKDFRKYTRGKLAALNQETLLTHSDALVALYKAQATVLQPFYALHFPTPAGEKPETLAEKAARLSLALRTADSARDTADIAIDTTITTLKSDWVKLAGVLRQVKGLLEYTFATDEEVYGFFDFSKAYVSKSQKKADKGANTTPPVA